MDKDFSSKFLKVSGNMIYKRLHILHETKFKILKLLETMFYIICPI